MFRWQLRPEGPTLQWYRGEGLDPANDHDYWEDVPVVGPDGERLPGDLITPSVFKVQEGDVVVLRASSALSDAETERLADVMETLFPNNKNVVLGPDLTLEKADLGESV